mgnify:CR=1 FL=1
MACAIIISRHDKHGEGVERSRGRRETMRVWRFVFLLLLVATAAAASAAWWWLHRPLSLATDPVELSIELGQTPREIAEAWVRAGVKAEPILLYEWFRWSGQARKIRAGRPPPA